MNRGGEMVLSRLERSCLEIDAIALLLLILLFACASLGAPGTHDVDVFLRWMDNADRLGLKNGFAANNLNYPPLTSVILWIFYRIFHSLGATPFWCLKISEFFFLLATACLLYMWKRDLFATCLLVATFAINSVDLGYLDIYFALPLLGALWALRQRRYETASALATLAAAIKWQPLIVAPFALVYLLKGGDGRFEFRILLRALWPAAAIVFFFVWFYGSDPLDRSLVSATNDVALSGNALNLNWLLLYGLESLRPDIVGGLVHGRVTATGTHDTNFAFLYAGGIVFLTAYGMTLVAFIFRKSFFREFLLYVGLGYLVYFFFNTGVHENHLFLPVLIFFVLALEDPNYRRAAACLAVMMNLNLLLFYGFSGREAAFDRTALGIDITVPAALVATVCFLLFWSREMLHTPFFRRRSIAGLPKWLGFTSRPRQN